jgi:hypothetical protein
MFTRLSHPFLRSILFFVLLLAVGVPATGLAAPVAQGSSTAENEAVLVTYYESDVIPSDDTDGIVAGLSFYDDDTLELALDYLDGEEPVVAYGEYEETGDGVLVTLFGADDEEFDEPIELELLFDADETLVVLGTPGGLLGDEDVILYPVDVAAGDDEAGDEDLAYAVEGVYVSPIQFDESSNSMVVHLLNLLPDGEASLSSDPLNLEPPMFELGMWTDNGDGSVTLEVLGTVEEEYAESILLEFEVGEYGELMLGDLLLYPLSLLGQNVDEDTSDVEGGVTIYVTELTNPDADESILIYMMLNNDGTVILIDENETGALYGGWATEDETLVVFITGDGEVDFDEPLEMLFEIDEENALVATEYPVEIFGEEGLIFYPAGEGDDEGMSEGVSEGGFYAYESDLLPSEETDGIVISLVLGENGSAFFSVDLMDGEDPILQYGEWTSDDDGAVIVTITEGPDGEYDEPIVLIFEEDEDDFSLVLVEESVELFGDAGLVLHSIE